MDGQKWNLKQVMENKMLSEKQIENITHAIGLSSRSRKPYRNHYCASNPNESWEDLVARGLAIRRNLGKGMGGIYYHMSDKGLEFVLKNRATFDFDGRIKKLSTLVSKCND